MSGAPLRRVPSAGAKGGSGDPVSAQGGSGNRVSRRGARGARVVLLGFVVAALGIPSLAGAEGLHLVRTKGIDYVHLPIPGGGPIRNIYEGHENTMRYGDFADGKLPFPVRFLNSHQFNLNVSSAGYVTFGTVVQGEDPTASAYARERKNSPIPPDYWQKIPNRFIAAWWDDLSCGGRGSILVQTLGKAPHRIHVVEWRRCYHYNPFGVSIGELNMQLWLHEDRETIEVRYGEAEEGRADYPFSASVGVVNLQPTTPPSVETYQGLGCTPGCNASHWPTNTAILYSPHAELEVVRVEAPESLFPGMPTQLEATVFNSGVRAAEGARVRFWLSRSPGLAPGSVDLGTSEALPKLSRDDRHVVRFEASLPVDLAPGQAFLVAEVDPDDEVIEIIEENNLGHVSVLVAEAAADLIAADVELPSHLQSGEPLQLRWNARNLGPVAARGAAYSIRLTAAEEAGLGDPELTSGAIDLAPYSELPMSHELELPEGLTPGTYRIGVLFNEGGEIPEVSFSNNTALSEPFVYSGGELVVVGPGPSTAELGSPFCKALQARGGDGRYRWSAAPGTSLPPGLEIDLVPAEPEEGRAAITRLCGRPSSLGSFEVALEVRTPQTSAIGRFPLEVVERALRLEVVSLELPVASFGAPYEERLQAVGGQGSYRWEIVAGALPRGLHLSEDGKLHGVPETQGTATFIAKVRDSGGAEADGSVRLIILPPVRLACVGELSFSLLVGQPAELAVVAAGGTAPYRFSTARTLELLHSPKGGARNLGAAPPPGLHLDADGVVGGAPNLQGRYLWLLEVEDSQHQLAHCTATVDVEAGGEGGRGLSILTATLPSAVAGEPYEVQLQVSGASGAARWSLSATSELPGGLELSEEGFIRGELAPSALEGAATRELSVIVQVQDDQNRRGAAPLTIELLATRPPASAAPAPEEEPGSGCQSAAAPASLLGLAAWLLVGDRRRRLRAPGRS